MGAGAPPNGLGASTGRIGVTDVAARDAEDMSEG